MIPIEEFCKLHNACSDGREWALSNCETMADVWATARPEWLVWVATRPGVLDDRTLRLFAVYCARSCEHLLKDDRSRRAIDIAERFANGEATPEELQAASAAARAAASDAASDAAYAASDAAWAAVWDAASAAASAAEWDATWDAARDAAWAARAAASDAASDAARDRQAIWLRQHCTPNFSDGGE